MMVLPCLIGVQFQYIGFVDAPIHALSMLFCFNKSINNLFVSLLVSKARPVPFKLILQTFCELFQLSFNIIMQNDSGDDESGKKY